ncbi:leucyl/phenylalanyl-tRNA--protein transferase [Bacteriovorax sp. DB6_IX]|uniref:leucyl/phenylalanyl-tRNA--protein transferase n=1 Tax=Bacteriovorax sp. DB6_IX TaxID=1353530 RepID=UPI000389E22D|nr:leucyl/phenylalanyl-tRNA--protein transferase [Bacteriovorax sp. DB6_IX]EQC51278.1 leucyltransferase [Bacteriovorax sp. DB6_IX]
MPIIDFPSVEDADENGLVAIGGDLHPQSLMLAYSRGIFPWPVGPEYPLAWFSPDPRGVIYSSELHLPKKLKKELRKSDFRVSFNQKFEEVINICANVHANSATGTWITQEILEGYIEFHRQGHAYSVEVMRGELLVGGLYGVCLGKYISGESMFHLESNASKVALITLMHNLKQNDVVFLDTQMVTGITSSLGAREIERKNFIQTIQNEIKRSSLDFSNFDPDITHLYSSPKI